MLISYQWLKKYIDLPEDPQVFASRLVAAGVSVEQSKVLGGSVTQVVVAELLSVEKHPQADRLSLTKVSTGTETFQVVCGAKNIAVGQKVPLAKVGAVLPGDFQIKAAKIRGVESFGMLCSAKELGLAEDAEGILILPPDAPLGADFIQYMGLPDTLLELEITPNRADLLSHIGVAREAAALLNVPLRYPEAMLPAETQAQPKAKVTVEAKDLCFKYTARVIENVKIGPSPRWLVQTLERIGQKSINNVVDVTNYVLFELGQPLHAFDLDKLEGSQIVVRRTKAGEKLPLLDKTERELKPEMLVIADSVKPVALAGVMGGSNSQVLEGTRNILLESALFLPGSVRKTARQLSISTDSSYRFERGVDPLGLEKALDRAATLILEVAGGSLAGGVLSQSAKEPHPATVDFRPDRTDTILGLHVPAQEQKNILEALGCKVKSSTDSPIWQVTPPSYRLDLEREIDLIEEVARFMGYDRIPTIAPAIPSNLFPLKGAPTLEKEIQFTLHQAGISEAVNSTFLPEDFDRKLHLLNGNPSKNFQKVINPIADDQKVLRPTLLPSLLANLQLNLSHQQEKAALYELNKIFRLNGESLEEQLRLAVVLAGTSPATWYSPERKIDYSDIKGLAEDLLGNARSVATEWLYGQETFPYTAVQSFQVKNDRGETVITGGALHPKVLKEYGLSEPCFALELDWEAFHRTRRDAHSFQPLPKFPGAWRDIALVVPDGVTSAQVLAAIQEKSGAELKETRLFDLYRGPHVAEGSRSLAFRLVFRNDERTLTDQEVADQVARIVEHLRSRYSIALR